MLLQKSAERILLIVISYKYSLETLVFVRMFILISPIKIHFFLEKKTLCRVLSSLSRNFGFEKFGRL